MKMEPIDRTEQSAPSAPSIPSVPSLPSVPSAAALSTPCASTTDELLEQIGGLRDPFSLLVVSSMAVAWLLAALPVMAPAFISPYEKSENDTPFYTVQEEFGLAPSWFNPAEWTGSMVFLGNLVFGQPLSALTDAVGRRPVVSLCALLSGLSALLCSLAPSFPTLLAARFLLGAFFTPSFITNFVLASECLPFSSHSTCTFLFGMMWVTGYCLCSPLALLFPRWRQFLFVASVPSIMFGILLMMFLPESLSFLIAQGKEEEVEKYLRRVESLSRRRLNYNLKGIMGNESRMAGETSFRATARRTLDRTVLKRIVLSSYLWVADYFVYNGLSYSSTVLNVGNNHVNYVLSGLIEVPSYIICPAMLDRIGRRPTVSALHFGAAFTLGAMCFVGPEQPALFLGVWLAAKFCCACVFCCLFLYGAELFPIECRNFALGLCCAISNLGAIASPHAPSLDTLFPGGMFTIFGVLCFGAALITLLLPETKHGHERTEDPAVNGRQDGYCAE